MPRQDGREGRSAPHIARPRPGLLGMGGPPPATGRKADSSVAPWPILSQQLPCFRGTNATIRHLNGENLPLAAKKASIFGDSTNVSNFMPFLRRGLQYESE